MINIDKFKIFESRGKSFEKYINMIIQTLDEKEIKYEDLYKSPESLYMYVNKHPFSWSFVNNDVTVIIEKDGVTDTLGTYDIDSELDKSIDTVISYK
jgi:hypothetical protein